MARPTLLLDLDGTLVDSVPDLLASANQLMDARGLARLSAPEITAMIGDGAAVLAERVMAARGRTATEDDLQLLLQHYMAHPAAQTRPYPGAVQALERLAGAGWRFAVCTNKPVIAARAVLQRLGLLDRFAAVGGGDSYASRKPDPAHLLATLREAEGTPENVVMIGDHRNDVLAATAARIPCIFAAWGYGAPDMAAGAEIAQSFDAVPALATQLLNR